MFDVATSGAAEQVKKAWAGHVDMMPCRLRHCYLHGGELIRGRGDAFARFGSRPVV